MIAHANTLGLTVALIATIAAAGYALSRICAGGGDRQRLAATELVLAIGLEDAKRLRERARLGRSRHMKPGARASSARRWDIASQDDRLAYLMQEGLIPRGVLRAFQSDEVGILLDALEI